MSDCTDMTSQLARELTKGIRDEVEDVSAMFKKMAIIKDENEPEEDVSNYVIIDDETSKPEDDTKILSVTEKIEKAKVIAMKLRGGMISKQITENKYDYAGSQLTLFDLAS